MFCSCSNFWTSSISNHFDCEPPKCMLKSYPDTLKHKKVWVRIWPVSCPNPPLSLHNFLSSLLYQYLFRSAYYYNSNRPIQRKFCVCMPTWQLISVFFFIRLMQWIIQTEESVSVWLAEFYTVSTYCNTHSECMCNSLFYFIFPSNLQVVKMSCLLILHYKKKKDTTHKKHASFRKIFYF